MASNDVSTGKNKFKISKLGDRLVTKLSENTKSVFAGAAGLRHIAALCIMLITVGIAWGTNQADISVNAKADESQNAKIDRMEQRQNTLVTDVAVTKSVVERNEKQLKENEQKLDLILMELRK